MAFHFACNIACRLLYFAYTIADRSIHNLLATVQQPAYTIADRSIHNLLATVQQPAYTIADRSIHNLLASKKYFPK